MTAIHYPTGEMSIPGPRTRTAAPKFPLILDLRHPPKKIGLYAIYFVFSEASNFSICSLVRTKVTDGDIKRQAEPTSCQAQASVTKNSSKLRSVRARL